jgi:hypothetical protein
LSRLSTSEAWSKVLWQRRGDGEGLSWDSNPKPRPRESWHDGAMADRSRLLTERMSVSVLRAAKRRKPARIKFCALEGPMLVVIETDSEDDARALCADMGLEFVCLCDE